MDTLTNNFLDNDAVDLNLDGIKTDSGLITYTDDFAIPVENISHVEEVEDIKPEDAAPAKPLTEAERKERYKAYLMSMQELDFYTKHNFLMDGKTKRRLRKTISAKVDKGIIRIPEEIDLNNVSE